MGWIFDSNFGSLGSACLGGMGCSGRARFWRIFGLGRIGKNVWRIFFWGLYILKNIISTGSLEGEEGDVFEVKKILYMGMLEPASIDKFSFDRSS